MQFNDEDLKIIKEADIAGDAIPYLRSDKRIIQFFPVETLNKILNALIIMIQIII